MIQITILKNAVENFKRYTLLIFISRRSLDFWGKWCRKDNDDKNTRRCFNFAADLYSLGIDVIANPFNQKEVGYIPDRPYLYDKLTAREFLEFVGQLYGLSSSHIRERGDQLLQENGLIERADELIEAYSHGMKQRLVLSSALLHHPPLLIVDEPMVGLDPHGARQIKNRFREIADDGRTVFLSTHSLDVAQEVCDRVGIYLKVGWGSKQ